MTATIKVQHSGQTVTPNTPAAPDTAVAQVQRVTQVYFARKTVANNGTEVSFTKLNTTQNRRAGANYDAALGMTVYLVAETRNMRGVLLDAKIKPANNTLTGNTDPLSFMVFDGNATNENWFTAQTTIPFEVGNFDALKNNAGVNAAYTNLASHADKAIAKIQLRPSARATFNAWATALVPGTTNLEVVLDRNDKEAWAKGGTSNDETIGPNTYLNTGAAQNFVIANRVLNLIYARVATTANNTTTFSEAPYNFLSLNGNLRRRMAKVENNSSTRICYYVYDKYDNEVFIAEASVLSVPGRANGRRVSAVPRRFTRSEPAPGGEAVTNYYYTDGTIVTQGVNGTNPIVSYAENGTNVPLIRMPDSLDIAITDAVIAYGFSGTQRRYVNPDCFAGFIGTLSQYGLRGASSTGMCFADATSYPSVTHPNGDSVDAAYPTTVANQRKMVNAFVDWGFSEVIVGTAQRANLPRAHMSNAQHNSHIHSGNFDTAVVQILNP